MSLTTMWHGTGRRRFNQDSARTAVIEAEAQRDAYQGQVLSLELKLIAADDLIARQTAELEGLRGDLNEYQAAVDELTASYEDLHSRYDARGKELTALRSVEANRSSAHVPAPMDAHPEVYGQPTVPTNVTTLRARFTPGPVPAMPLGAPGGEAA